MKRRWLLLLAAGALAAAAGAEPRTRVERVLTVDGEVRIRRPGWTGASRLRFASAVEPGDLLLLAPGARATVACADLTVQPVAERRVTRSPCPDVAQPVLWWKGAKIVGTRALKGPPYVKVVAPRQTRILDRHPVVRWLGVSGATAYRVTVGAWSAVVTGANEVRYPAGAPELEAGVGYLVTVEVTTPAALAGISSRDERAQGAGFSVVAAGEARAIGEAGRTIAALHVEAAGRALLRATVLAGAGASSEAIGMLEELFKVRPSAEVAAMIGSLYRETGVPELARPWYETARARAEKEDDAEAAARSAEALAALAEARGDDGAAKHHIAEAVEGYRRLGSQQDIERLSGGRP